MENIKNACRQQGQIDCGDVTSRKGRGGVSYSVILSNFFEGSGATLRVQAEPINLCMSQIWTFNHRIKLQTFIIKNLLIFFHFCANYRLIREALPLRSCRYPMMLRSAASPGSWGRSASRQVIAVPRAVLHAGRPPFKKTPPLPEDGRAAFFCLRYHLLKTINPGNKKRATRRRALF